MNIVEPILFQARYQLEAAALCVLGKQVIGYAVLRNQTNNVARRAKSHGLARGDIVAVATDQPIVEAAVILGPTRLGIATTSLGMLPPDGLKIDAVIRTAAPTLSAARHLPLDDAWTTGDGAQLEAMGVAESMGGQELWAAVVCPDKFDAKAIRAHCRARMPAHFVPKHVVNLDELPMSPLGKVMLPRLRAIVAAKKSS